MTDKGKKLAGGGAKTTARDEALAPQAWMMIKTFWWDSPGRNKLFLLGTGICTVVALTAYAQIELNAWNKPFYNALSLKDFAGFLHQLLVFAVLAGALLTLNVAQAWLREMTKLKAREDLTHDLFDQWLVPKRAFRLSTVGAIGVNPDQRIHEDARHLVELSTSALACSNQVFYLCVLLPCYGTFRTAYSFPSPDGISVCPTATWSGRR
jgi:vitamin B12/bleomycin/antimicrobial peptide transport system ATP-binding/permease protein